MVKQFVLAVIAIGCISYVQFINGESLTLDRQHDIYQCPDPSLAIFLLCRMDIKETGTVSTTLKETVNCPESGVNKNPISCIIVTNELGDEGGYAEIGSGTGLNDYKVQIILESQVGKGLNYHIEVWTL